MSKALGGIFGGGGGSQVTTSSPSIPGYVKTYQRNMFNQAQSTAKELGARQFADFSPLQQQVFGAVGGLNQGFTPQAMQAAEQGIAGMASNAFLGGRIADYQSPYISQVIDQSMMDIDRARQLQQQGINAQALSRGAFGGSRQAVAEAENARNFLDQQARTAAGLRAQGYESALAAAQADRQAQMQNFELMNRSFLGNLQAQMGAGGMQQDLSQQRLDALRNLPLERLGILSSTFTGGQLPYGQTQVSPTQKSNPFGSALGGAATGAGLATALGGSATTGALLGAAAAFL